MVMPRVRKQLYRCRACGRQSRENPTPHAYPEALREEILHASQERSSLRGLTRTDCASLVPPYPIESKKVAQLPPLQTTLLAPDPEDPASTTLELDELWSFVLKKAHDTWIWIALCCKTRQAVAYAVGDRSLPDVPAAVGSDSAGVSAGTLRNVFLGGLRGGDPRGAAYNGGKRDGRNGPRRAMEQHLAPTSGSFCAHDVVHILRR
jgi:IS1 transposase